MATYDQFFWRFDFFDYCDKNKSSVTVHYTVLLLTIHLSQQYTVRYRQIRFVLNFLRFFTDHCRQLLIKK